jgi:hypothetical protein
MDLTVILGPPGAGKAGRTVELVRESAARGVDAFLCVPGAVERARFLRELAAGESAAAALVGVEVGTFEQLVARVAGSPPVRRTDRAMERIVVRDALRDVPAFAGAARWSGFVDTARAHVDELRRARAWGGAALEAVERGLPGQDLPAWHRLEERVGALLDERRLRDDAWFERRASRQLRAGRPGVGSVYVYGFEALAPGRVELIERLARCVPVTVTLAWRPGRRVHERAAELRDRWRAAGAFIEELDAGPASHPLLEWLGSELFEDTSHATAPVVDATERADQAVPVPVSFVDCSGPVQEAEEVVREVALLRSRGLAWDDVVVASADAARDGELLLAAFDRAGIPARLQAHRRAVDVPAGRAVHELLDAAVEGDALRLVAALRAPILDVDRSRVDEAELRLRRTRHAGTDALASPALRRVLPPAVSGLLARRAPGTPAVDAVRELLGSLLPGDLGELDLLQGIVALLEGLVVAAGGEQHVSLVDVRDAVAAFPLTVPDRSDSGAVVIASLADLRSIAYDAVVLRGMHLAAFRAPVDDELDAPAAARDLLHLAVTRARRTLRVVRQATGADGGHLAPSPGWQELRRLVPDAPLRTRRLGEVLVPPDRVRLASELEPSIALARGAGVHIEDVPADVIALLDSHYRHARTPRVGSPIVEELRARTTIAATELEQYATCSAKWFIERRLRVSDVDDDRTRIVDGLLSHALLQRLVPAHHAGDFDGNESALSTRAHELAIELAAEVDDHGVLHPARIERIVEHVLDVIRAEADWQRPDSIETERNLGRDAEDSIGPGLLVRGVEVVGRVDRIDRHGSRVVLHDYKHGSSDRPLRTLLDDRNLQLLVYWLALEQAGSPVEPIGAVYRAVTSAGTPSGAVTTELRDMGLVGSRAGALDEDARRDLLDEARRIVEDAVTAMRDGVVAPLDDPAKCPTYCRLQPVCRVGEVRA